MLLNKMFPQKFLKVFFVLFANRNRLFMFDVNFVFFYRFYFFQIDNK